MKKGVIIAVCTTIMLIMPWVQVWGTTAPSGSPTRAIQNLDDEIATYRTGDHLTAKDRTYNVDLKHRIIHGTFDVRELCRLALSKHWDGRSNQEREQFVDLMISLLEERALFSKEQAATRGKKGSRRYHVSYVGEKYLNAEKTKVLVRTRLSIPSERVEVALNYRLRKTADTWKIYDVIVDEASLLDNYRYQFNDIITKNGYPDLVGRMSKKLSEIRSKRQGSS